MGRMIRSEDSLQFHEQLGLARRPQTDGCRHSGEICSRLKSGGWNDLLCNVVPAFAVLVAAQHEKYLERAKQWGQWTLA